MRLIRNAITHSTPSIIKRLLIIGCVSSFFSHADSKLPLTTLELEALTSSKTIPELQSLLLDGSLSVEQLTQFYINKIDAKDHLYQSVLAINPNALDVARALDEKLSRYDTNTIPALYGMPILLKDNIETALLPTTAGSLALKDNWTNRDATVTAKLKEAGAIILGKTNLSEWANFRSERSSSGWSAIGGQTKNPHDVTRSACGSSSGSGAAIAANFAVAAIGTETNGSITCPAAVTGVVGIKPSVGLVSRFGIVPISPSQDTAGPMAKNIVDAKRVLFAIQGIDNKDQSTNSSSLQPISKDVKPLDLSSLRIGVIHSSAEQHEGVADIMTGVTETLNIKGVTLIPNLKFQAYDGFGGDAYKQLLREFKTALNDYFETLPAVSPYRELTLEKLITFNNENSSAEMPYFQQEIFVKSQATKGMNTPEYRQLKLRLQTTTGKENIEALLVEHNLDALIAITRGPAWKIDRVNGDHTNGGVSTFSAVSGLPHITFPVNELHGLPIGLSVMTGTGGDQKSVDIANAIKNSLK